MNLKKYTKDELINKFRNLESKQLELLNSKSTKSSDNTTFIQVILESILYFKAIILKITFITLIIKIFKRFKILRRIWLILNTIVMSIFGISMIDLYGLSIFSAFFTEI